MIKKIGIGLLLFACLVVIGFGVGQRTYLSTEMNATNDDLEGQITEAQRLMRSIEDILQEIEDDLCRHHPEEEICK